ncbi:MAG: NAD(P)H-dependent oxidoreductase, partial [Desulfobacterales bacterium]|nr:NAD(P)H-dependent oxidoreductase [Desulfobacterales bacterium]
MKITVLNGSPKGDISVTLQSLRFIEKKIPDITLCVHHISQRIKRISKENNRFEAIMNDIDDCDAVIWSTPLYVTTVPSQYHRFIEMISEKKKEAVFKDKYAAVITTSIHFFDHTAHTFMRAVCEDLGMKYVDGFSPDMYDLLKEDQQNQLLNFAKHFVDVVKTEKNTSKLFAPLVHDPIVYSPGPVKNKIDLKGKKILILADSRENKNLKGMIDRYTASFSSEVDVAYLQEINIKGGCIGCCKCGPDNECSYDGTDDYKCFYNEGMRTADVVIFAGATKGRYLSWQVKQFFDRSFFNTHTPTLKGKQI